MANLTPISNPTPVTLVPSSNKHSGLLAGEAITRGDLCYIKSDGKVWKTNGTAANAAAEVDGIALESAAIGEACTLGFDIEVEYTTGLTPGAKGYASTTAGAVSDAATTGGTKAVTRAVTATRIFVMKSRY